MKFTDMNFDCLETVLEYLELIDLLNVADSTKRLNEAAELVYARKHGKKNVIIFVTKISRKRSFEINDGAISIRDLKTVLQLLRCLGPVISKIIFLELNVGKQRFKMDEKVVAYINKYCANYLEELEIGQYGFKRSVLLHYFDRPFSKLTKFKNNNFAFNENSCLNRFFPKMRCLDISSTLDLSFYDINTKHFPYLEELSIYNDGLSEPFLCNEMVINLLQLNPQLRKLTIYIFDMNSILNTDLIRSAVDSSQNVESLSLHNLKPITFLDDGGNIIRMKSVKTFIFIFDLQDFGASSYLLPFLFENLESFHLDFPQAQFVNRSFTDEFFNFIDRHPSITNLSILQIKRFGDVDWTRLAKSLPLLLEIEIILCYISANEAIEIMTKFQTLKRFRFRLSDDYDSFRNLLDKKWNGTYMYKTIGVIVELKR